MIAIMAVFLVRGLVRGLVRETMGLIGIVLAIFLSETSHKPLAAFLGSITGMENSWWDAIAFGIILIMVFLVIVYLGNGLSKLIHSGPFSTLDRLGGGAAGLVKGVLLCFLLLNLLVLAKPNYTRPLMKKSVLTGHVQSSGNIIVDLIPDSWTQKIRESSSILKNSLSKPQNTPGSPGENPRENKK